MTPLPRGSRSPISTRCGFGLARADSAGLQIAVHAIGERANATVLDIFDSVAKAHGPRDRRFRIEHAQHLRPVDVDRIAAQNVIASMQPYHLIDDGRWAEKRLGPTRIHDAYVFRDLLNLHAHLAFGSDWTVAPIDPILGLYAAVTRRTLDGKNPGGWLPDQKITLEEALRSYTAEVAYANFAERTRGKLTPGRKADLVGPQDGGLPAGAGGSGQKESHRQGNISLRRRPLPPGRGGASHGPGCGPGASGPGGAAGLYRPLDQRR